MSLHRRRVWPGLLGRYLVFVTVLGLVAASVYAAVDADQRPAVLRLAVAAFVAVALVHIYGHIRQRLEEGQASAFDQARRGQPVEVKVAPMVLRLKESVQYGVASPSHFKKVLWPRLVRLSEERGRRESLQEPHGRPWLRRGPSLAAIAELVRQIGDER